MIDKDQYKGFGAILGIVDTTLSGLFGALGIVSGALFFFAPVIWLLYGIRWLFMNGYIG